jgi:hypothetical protein
MSREEDLESIASLETESEGEYEPKPVKLNKAKKTIETKDEPEVQYTKTGRIKKPMSEAQKENLSKARIKARAVRKELKELRDAEKNIKKDDRLIRKLEVEAKILNHNEKKKELFKKAGYVNDEVETKPKKKQSKVNEEETEEQQIKALEEKLSLLKKKEVKEVVEKPKKKKVATPISSPEESEEENEVIHETPKVVRRKGIQTPVMDLKPKRAENQNPMARQAKKEVTDPAIRAQLLSLFPNYQF